METTIRTYGRTELAQLYFPAICPRAAWAKLRLYMSDYPRLRKLLACKRRTFLPVEVSLIFDTLGRSEGVKGVSGMGLMIGIQTVKPAGEIVAYCRDHGVLVLTAKDKVRLLPPLNIPMEQLQKAVAVIQEACKA